MNTDWVVYSNSCLSHTDGMATYLARYSHRIAISDWRVLSIEKDQARFCYKDYADDNRQQVLPLSTEEVIRRFLLHVLPKGKCGFVITVFWPIAAAKPNLLRPAALALLVQPTPMARTADDAYGAFDDYSNTQCRIGRLHVIGRLAPRRFEGR